MTTIPSAPVDAHTAVRNLARSGRLVFSHWVVTEGSTSGNDGRPARAYRLAP